MTVITRYIADAVCFHQNKLTSSAAIAYNEGWMNRMVLALMLREYRRTLKQHGLYFNRVAAQSIKTLRIITHQFPKKA